VGVGQLAETRCTNEKGDEQFSLKRRRFGMGMAICSLVTVVLTFCNQALDKL